MEVSEPHCEVRAVSNPLEMVQEYLSVLQTTDLEKYRAANCMLDDVMFDNKPIPLIQDAHTFRAIDNLIDYQHRPVPDRLERLNSSRKSAAVNVVRFMIRGKKFPTDQFGEVISAVLDTMAQIDNTGEPSRKHTRQVRRVVLETWSGSSVATKRRAAEAFMIVGRPRVLGRMINRVARLES